MCQINLYPRPGDSNESLCLGCESMSDKMYCLDMDRIVMSIRLRNL